MEPSNRSDSPTRIKITKRTRVDSDSERQDSGPSTFKKKLTLKFRAPQPPQPFHPKALELWNKLVNATDPNGRTRSDVFMDLPSATDYPDYYIIIKKPMALNQVKQNLVSQQYPSMDKFIADLRLVFNNAKKYNLEYSIIFDDARALLQIVKREVAKINAAAALNSTTAPQHPEEDHQLQSESDQPKQKKITLKLRPPPAVSVTMASSAPPPPPVATLNPPADPEPPQTTAPEDNQSPSWLPLKASFTIKPTTSTTSKPSTDNTSKPTARPSNNKPAPSALSAPAEKPPTVINNPKRELTLKAWIKAKLRALEETRDANNHKRKLIDAFQTLPDRAISKNYYEIIDHPLAFENIRGKNDKRSYKDLESFKKDVDLIFHNAQLYNKEGSDVWKDAHILKEKFHQLIKDSPAEFPESVPRGPYKKTQERKLEATTVAVGASNNNSTITTNANPTRASTPVQQQLALPSLPTTSILRTSPPLNSVNLPSIPPDVSSIQQTQLLAPPSAPPVKPAGPRRSASPLSERILRSASRSPSSRDRATTPTTLATTVAPPTRVPTPLRSVIHAPSPTVPALASNTILPSSFALNLPTSLPSIPQSGLGVSPLGELGAGLSALASSPNVVRGSGGGRACEEKLTIKLPSDDSPSLVKSFNLITIPPTTYPMCIRNNFSRQHSLRVPVKTKAVKLICSILEKPEKSKDLSGSIPPISPTTTIKCRGQGRVVKDGSEAFVIEILDASSSGGVNIVEVLAGEEQAYRLFIYK